MVFPWLLVLQNVPWTQVISNAPKVAEGARKLWNAVSRKPVASSASPEGVAESAADVPPSPTALSARLATLEVAIADLHDQMLASSELIKSLADQNAQLIQRIEKNRVRTLWLAGATIVAGAIAATCLVVAVVT